MRRRLLALAGLATGPGILVYRRLRRARSEHVDVYFDDGSFVTFAAGSAEASRLLPLVRQVLATARPE